MIWHHTRSDSKIVSLVGPSGEKRTWSVRSAVSMSESVGERNQSRQSQYTFNPTRSGGTGVPKFDYLTTSPAEQQADLLLLPFFEGPEAGPGMKEVGKALGTDLVATLRDNGIKGKLGDTFTVPTLGRVPAGTALLVGLGPQAEAGADEGRPATGKI